MGKTGPCGPCSEIHYDSTPEKNGGHLVNLDDPNVIEIWNLVFIQYNRGDDGTLAPLPNQHVDTGMGLERIVRVLQGKNSNYDTDLWTPIFTLITKLTGAPAYSGDLHGQADIAYRVLADHIRCLVVAIADGGRPGAAGREYVLRRILRRAVRHAHQTFGVDGPLLHKLVPAVVETLGEVFPEIQNNEEHIAQIIFDEEESFLKTLDRGIELFEKAVEEGDGKSIDATSAFTLHDTFGFPIDLTQVMAEERSLSVDRAGYEVHMEKAREASRAISAIDQKMHLPPEILGKFASLHIKPTNDEQKYGRGVTNSRIKAIWNGKEIVAKADGSMVFGLVLNKTPMYAEQGGQVGDVGHIVREQNSSQDRCEFLVNETHRYGDYVLHIGRMLVGVMLEGDQTTATVNEKQRANIEANHTSTHLLNHALRAVLGDDVQQRGSLVDHDRLRFDFSFAHAMTDKQVAQVENLVSSAIADVLHVDAKEVALNSAKEIYGVRAVFGEQYPDPVRVVSIGATVDELLENPTDEKWYNCSVEFCGGTHLENTQDAKHFVLLHEQALASGIRRIIAVTGITAEAAHIAGASLMQQIDDANTLKGEELVRAYNELIREVDELTVSQPTRHAAKQALQSLHSRVRDVQKEVASSMKDHVLDQARVIADLKENIIVATINGADKESMMTALDAIRSKRPKGAAILFTSDVSTGKVIIVAGVSSALIKKGLKAGDWVREAARRCGGSGGGRPDTAQAGGKEPEKVPASMDWAGEYASEVTQ
jgi:alanyl-tRNA synthetase